MPMQILDVDTIAGFWPARNVDISVERLQHVMARHGVSGACVCSARGIWYDAVEGNEETLQLARSDTRFWPVMMVDPRRWLGAREEIRRRVAEGHRVFRLFPEYQGWSPALSSVRRILGYLEDEGAVVVLGGPADAAVPVIRSLRVPVVLAGCHFYQLSEVLACAEALENVYLSTRFLIAPGSLDIAASHLGADRLLFGSHAPLAYMAPALHVVENAALAAEARAGVLGGNLRRLLGDKNADH